MDVIPTLSLLLLTLFPFSIAQNAPLVYWYNHPVQPNETVLVFGNGMNNAIINLCDNSSTNCINPPVLSSWDSSVKFLIPETAKKSAFFFSVCQKTFCSRSYSINVPEIWWIESDDGENTTSWVKIFGKSLAFVAGDCIPASAPVANNSGTMIVLSGNSSTYNITDIQASCYDLFFSLPSGIAPGIYNVSVQNSLSSILGVLRDGDPMQINVVPTIPLPSTIFDVRKQFNGNLSDAINAANEAGGGKVYLSTGPDIYMKDQEVITMNDRVYLSGDGVGESVIYWDANSVIPPTPLVTTLGRFGIQGVSIIATSPTRAIIHVTATSSGYIRNIASIRTSMTDVQNMFQIDGSNVEVSNSFFNHSGDCSKAGWPGNCGFWLNGTSHVRLLDNTFMLHCQGYAGFGVDKILMEGNTIVSSSNITSDGSGFSTLGTKMCSEKVAFLRNYHEGDFNAPVRYETYTSDGPGAAYLGGVSPSQSNAISLSLLANATYGENNYYRGAVVVVNGTGAGQVRRVANYSSTFFTLTEPLDVLLDSTSFVSIIPYRAETLLAGNNWKNGTVVQIYGAGFHTVIADNNLFYMNSSHQINPAGIVSWGLDYHGVQPTFFTEILGNTLIDAEAITAFARISDDFSGPYLRAHVIKGNSLTTNTIIDIIGTSSDIVIEANTITGLPANQSAVEVSSSSDHILIR